MESWIIAALIAAAVLSAAAILATVILGSRSRHRRLAGEWETERAAIAAVVREDLQTLRSRVPAPAAGAVADALRAAGEAAERFAANEDWAVNLRAATAASGRAARLLGPDSEAPPCLFNPVHGPATAEVEWAPGGGARRRVPVCAADAGRLRAGEPPQVRTVGADGVVVPYFAADGRYVDWLLGWFDGQDPYLTARLLAGTAIGAHLPGRIRALHGAAADPLGEFGPVH